MTRLFHCTWVLIVGVLIGVFANGATAANIETVPVGNPGNAADARYPDTYDGVYGFGSVDYTYNIGKYEVTAGQYTDFLNKVAATDTYGLYKTSMWSSSYGCCKIQRSGAPGSYTYSVASDYANRPVNYVSWGDAARFANWLHNNQPTGSQNASTTEGGAYTLNGATSDADLLAVQRNSNWKWAITSEDEWYKAAYYKGGSTDAGYWDYPTSSDMEPGRDMTDASGNNANYYNSSSPYPIDSGKYTTVVGEFQNSASPYGTFDQGGNVWEWNESVNSGSYRGLRGGSFNSYFSGRFLLASYRGYDLHPAIEVYDLGFRVSEVPEPTTMALLAFGGVGMLVRRRGLGR